MREEVFLNREKIVQKSTKLINIKTKDIFEGILKVSI